MNYRVIDSHCHIYLPEFQPDVAQMLEKAESEGVTDFYMPCIDSTVINDMLKVEEMFPGKCHAMMGLHPGSVKENYQEELRIVQEWFEKRRFAAVGEIGLDFYWDKSFVKQQEEVFQCQIEIALKYQRPVVIHSRESIDRCIEIVSEYSSRGLSGVFHCFTGTVEQGKKIVDLGFYLGIGGVLTYKNSDLKEVVKGLPVERMVLETDAPYLTPVPFRGKRNESAYLKYVLEKLSESLKISVENLAGITTSNSEKLFG